jgi:hypothetical protein
MGYSFSCDPPSDHARHGCAFNDWQMTYVRLVMVEAGAINGDGLKAPDLPGFEVEERTLRAKLFLSNDGWRISAEDAGFIAARLRAAVAAGVVGQLLSFFDDAPPTAEVREWVEEFATFNESAAARDGYYVT